MTHCATTSASTRSSRRKMRMHRIITKNGKCISAVSFAPNVATTVTHKSAASRPSARNARLNGAASGPGSVRSERNASRSSTLIVLKSHGAPRAASARESLDIGARFAASSPGRQKRNTNRNTSASSGSAISAQRPSVLSRPRHAGTQSAAITAMKSHGRLPG